MVRSFFVGQLSDSGQIFGEKVSAAGWRRGAAIFIRLGTRIFFAQRQRGGHFEHDWGLSRTGNSSSL